MGLVRDVLGNISNEFAMQVAAHSVPAVMAAQPIEPLPNERVKGNEVEPNWIYNSPEQRYLDYPSSNES